jgi:formate-dependent nitrite reductase membrane component NrfD
MLEDLNWGLPVIAYLFLAGLGAGVLTVSASVLLRGGGGGFGGGHFAIARYGAFIAPLPIIAGCILLIAELGSAQAGHWFKWLNLYTTLTWSPMSIGTWLVTIGIVVSVVYAFTFWRKDAAPGDRYTTLRRACAWVLVPLGIAIAVYTGILLGAMPSRPFWNSPVLPLLFLLSSLSTGIAILTLARLVLRRRAADPAAEQSYHDSGYLLGATDLVFIGFELLAIFLFIMFAQLAVGSVSYAVNIVMAGGAMTILFWVGVVGVGLLIPALIGLRVIAPRLLFHKTYRTNPAIEFLMPVLVLAGGVMLRYVVVIAGQTTGPVGI